MLLPIESALAQSSFMFSPGPPKAVGQAKGTLKAVPPVGRRKVRTAPQNETTTEANHCVDCPPANVMRPAPERIVMPGRARAPRTSGLSFRNYRAKRFSQSCTAFISQEGTYGSVGQRIANSIQGKYRSSFLADHNSLQEVCPKYKSFQSDELRTQAWVWFWMVLANEESGCKVNLNHGTHLPNGRRLNPVRGYGLFAAELYQKDRNFRGAACRGDIRTASLQVSCALDTMSRLQLNKGRGVLTMGSYWGPVRRSNRQIMPNMKGFKACFQK